MMNLRTLALAAALIGSITAPAFADQDRVPEGATASGAYVGSASRTMLGYAGGDLLSQSGATGGGGQHS